MDVFTEILTSDKGNDSMFVIVEMLSKRCIFIPTNKGITSTDVVRLLFEYVCSKHGMPESIILDRHPLFTSKYFERIIHMLNIKKNIASKGHPKSDGQSENTIRTLSQMQRRIIQKKPMEWYFFLSELKFEYNAIEHKSTKLTPFKIDLGYVSQSQLAKQTGISSNCQAAVNRLER